MFFRVSNLIKTFKTYWVETSTQYIQVVYNSFSADYPVSYQKIGIYTPTKREVLSVQGMVKNQLEIVEVGKASLFPHIYSL